MFVFACPIIARSQCWLLVLRANISVFALEFNFRYLCSTWPYMSKYKERCNLYPELSFLALSPISVNA